MALTPLEVEKLKFRVGFRGYVREDVEQFRDGVVAALEQAIALTQQLQARVGELEAQLKRYQEHEELLKNSVVLAQRTSDELIAAAHKQADVIKQQARGEGDEIRRELAELRSQREQFEYAFHGLLSGFLHRLEQGNPALAGEESAPELTASGQARSVEPEPQQAADPPNAQLAGRPASERVEPAQPEPATRPVPRIPDVPTPPTPTIKPFVPPAASTAKPTGAEQVDRDADIDDFSAALDEAKAPPQVWPKPAEQMASPPEPSDPPAAEPESEPEPVEPETGLPLDREWGNAGDTDDKPDQTL